MNQELPDVQAGFRKGRGTRSNCQHLLAHWKSERVPENLYFCFIDYAKSFVWITTKCGKFLKKWEYQTTWPAYWEICRQVKKQQLELDMEQQTGSKSGTEYVKAVYYHPAYLTSIRVHHEKCWLDEAQAGIKFAGRNINNLRYADDTNLLA